MWQLVDRHIDEYMELSWLEIRNNIEWYEWLYQVSNLWRVRSIPRTVDINRSFKGKIWNAKYNIKWWIIQPSLNKNTGHLCVHLINWWQNTRKTYSIIKLVYCSFRWKRLTWFKKMLQHIDWNKENNKLSNIRIHDQKHHTEKKAAYKFLKEIENNWFDKNVIYDLLNKIENNWSLIGTSIGKKALDTENLILDFVEEQNKWCEDEDDMSWVWDFTLLEFFTRIQRKKTQ